MQKVDGGCDRVTSLFSSGFAEKIKLSWEEFDNHVMFIIVKILGSYIFLIKIKPSCSHSMFSLNSQREIKHKLDATDVKFHSWRQSSLNDLENHFFFLNESSIVSGI